ncbi:MAG: hypothetical protein AAGF87_08875 [Bacteroidota bacterium]
MATQQYSQVYRQFADIELTDYQRLIRTYEELEREIGRLDVDEYFELTVRYVDALFHSGAYRRHLLMVDAVIEASIERNLVNYKGRDIFSHMLFCKAASAYRIQDYKQARHVTQELIKIHPERPLYRRMLRAIGFREQQNLLQFGRAAFIFCLLAAALVIVVDLLVVDPFYPGEHQAMLWLRNDLFIIALVLLSGCFGFAWWKASWNANRFGKDK